MKTVRLKDEGIDNVVAHLSAQLREGNKVVIPGIGAFKVKDCAARVGRNPKTGEPVNIPAKKKVTFKADKNLLG